MLKLVADKDSDFIISDLDLHGKRSLYTIEVLEEIQKQYKNKKIWFLIGSDNLKELYTWENAEELISKYKVLVNEAKINAKPRLRMTTLYYIAQSLNYLVIGTGNKCEAVVGYTTKWGDNAHDFNPIGEFTVEEVLQIGEYLGVPDKIIKKAPNDGLGGLTDEEKLGVTYKQIAEYIETGKTEENALEIIKKKEMISMHKKMPIPVYKRNDI